MRQQGNKKILTIQEYAKDHGINRSTVYKQIKAGKLDTETIDDVLHVVEILSTSTMGDAKEVLISKLEEEVQSLKSQNEDLRKTNGLLLEELSHVRQDAEESRRRSDILIAQLQEYVTRPWWRRVTGRKQLPASIKNTSSTDYDNK